MPKAESLYYQFCDWEKMFVKFYELKASDDAWQLVLSTHWATSGYWIEQNPEPTSHEEFIVYRKASEVSALEHRIRVKREAAAIYDEQGEFKGYPVSLGGLIT